MSAHSHDELRQLLNTRAPSGGEVEFDLARRSVHLDGQQVALTPREWLLVDALALRDGVPTPRLELQRLLARVDSESTTENAVAILLCNLRRKLGSDVLQTIRGRGYRLVPSPH